MTTTLVENESSAPNLPGALPFEGGDYSVRLDFFSGPMDLLLHLVQQREVSIAEVNMTELCEQYLQIVSRAAVLDLERASEYLVVAATLMAIKSQSLLPQSVNDETGEYEDFDPKFFENLRERLQTYQLTKMRAQALRSAPQLGRTTFARGRFPLAPVVEEENALDEIDLGESRGLGVMFLKLLKRIGKNAKTFRVSFEPISVVSYMMKLVDGLKSFGLDVDPSSREKRSFRGLIRSFFEKARTTAGSGEGNANETTGRGVVIGSFIALLELMKRGLVTATQEIDSEEIGVVMNFASVGSDVTRERLVDELSSDGFNDDLGNRMEGGEVGDVTEFKSAHELRAEKVIPLPVAHKEDSRIEDEEELREVVRG